MKIRILLFPFWALLISFCSLATASAGEVLILERGTACIRGLLPDAWREMNFDEKQMYLKQKDNLLQSAGKLLNAFLRPSTVSDTNPVLFVFHAATDQQVTEEQREKMYAWFEKNREATRQIAPDEISNLSLENIEYLHDRNTIIFETKVEVQQRHLHGMSAIVFLDRGYLNIIGYEADELNLYRKDFYSFIKTLSIPEEFKYKSKMNISTEMAWFIAHWQQLAGVFLFIAVYGFVFGKKGRKIIPSS